MSKKLALCIGINNYPGTANDLNGCVNDANDWAAVFQQRGFTVKKLLDSSATKKNMLAEMKALLSGAKRGDNLVIQYSGHGTYVPDVDGDEPDQTDECLVPYDVNTKGVITDDELFEIFISRPTGAKLVFLSDSCNSGTVAKFAPITTPPTVAGKNPPQRKVKFLPPATFLSKREVAKFGITRAVRRSSPPGRYGGLLMSGCQDVESSWDAYFNGRPNGAFTFVALKTLKSLKPNATYKQWFAEIRKVLPSQQYPQSPNLYGAASMKRWKVL